MLSLFKKALSTYESGRYYPFIYGNSEDKCFSFSVSLPKVILQNDSFAGE